MSQVIYDDLSLKRFLRLPEAKPALEFFEGKVVQKVAPKRSHSVIHSILLVELFGFARQRRLGQAFVELRCTFGGASIVPDISVFNADRVPTEDDVTSPPDLIVEIISPGQTVRDLSRRLEWCASQGVRLGWLIQPRQKRAFVFRPGTPMEVLGVTDVLNGGDVLPQFTIALAEVFGWLAAE